MPENAFSLIFGHMTMHMTSRTSRHPINLRSDTQSSGSCLPSKRMAEDAHETSEWDRLWRHGNTAMATRRRWRRSAARSGLTRRPAAPCHGPAVCLSSRLEGVAAGSAGVRKKYDLRTSHVHVASPRGLQREVAVLPRHYYVRT